MSEAPQADLVMRAGLLMEAAEAQQRLGEQCVERLQAHLRDLDSVVRDEIHHTLSEAIAGLVEETTQAAQALRRLRHTADVRVLSWTVAVTVISAVLGAATMWRLLPSAAEIATLRARRAALLADIARLEHSGARVQLRRCGARGRLCVRVDRRGPAYGPHGDFLPVKGR